MSAVIRSAAPAAYMEDNSRIFGYVKLPDGKFVQTVNYQELDNRGLVERYLYKRGVISYSDYMLLINKDSFLHQLKEQGKIEDISRERQVIAEQLRKNGLDKAVCDLICGKISAAKYLLSSRKINENTYDLLVKRKISARYLYDDEKISQDQLRALEEDKFYAQDLLKRGVILEEEYAMFASRRLNEFDLLNLCKVGTNLFFNFPQNAHEDYSWKIILRDLVYASACDVNVMDYNGDTPLAIVSNDSKNNLPDDLRVYLKQVLLEAGAVEYVISDPAENLERIDGKFTEAAIAGKATGRYSMGSIVANSHYSSSSSYRNNTATHFVESLSTIRDVSLKGVEVVGSIGVRGAHEGYSMGSIVASSSYSASDAYPHSHQSGHSCSRRSASGKKIRRKRWAKGGGATNCYHRGDEASRNSAVAHHEGRASSESQRSVRAGGCAGAKVSGTGYNRGVGAVSNLRSKGDTLLVGEGAREVMRPAAGGRRLQRVVEVGENKPAAASVPLLPLATPHAASLVGVPDGARNNSVHRVGVGPSNTR